MKTNIVLTLAFLFISFSFVNVAAQVQNIKLKQTTGAFETQELTLAPGEYQFEIANDGIDHEVGFVLVPKGKYDAADHIKTAYVKAPVAEGKSSLTDVVSLEAGEYEYFCPLNPTPKYSLTVAKEAKTIKLVQTPGKFENQNLSLAAGTYQFEIANDGIDHEVGFVLVPKGKYDAADHIKAAYVQAPVAEGKSSLTNIVTLEAGEYEYFCPLNPTPKYSLTVAEETKTVKLVQTPGKFENQNLSLTAGTYQFEIANDGIGHEVGFVLVPKGKYDAADHIKAAYVKAPVAEGKSSLTNNVTLEAGEYEYFCPLNPTPKYTLVVE